MKWRHSPAKLINHNSDCHGLSQGHRRPLATVNSMITALRQKSELARLSQSKHSIAHSNWWILQLRWEIVPKGIILVRVHLFRPCTVLLQQSGNAPGRRTWKGGEGPCDLEMSSNAWEWASKNKQGYELIRNSRQLKNTMFSAKSVLPYTVYTHSTIPKTAEGNHDWETSLVHPNKLHLLQQLKLLTTT